MTKEIKLAIIKNLKELADNADDGFVWGNDLLDCLAYSMGLEPAFTKIGFKVAGYYRQGWRTETSNSYESARSTALHLVDCGCIHNIGGNRYVIGEKILDFKGGN